MLNLQEKKSKHKNPEFSLPCYHVVKMHFFLSLKKERKEKVLFIARKLVSRISVNQVMPDVQFVNYEAIFDTFHEL